MQPGGAGLRQARASWGVRLTRLGPALGCVPKPRVRGAAGGVEPSRPCPALQWKDQQRAGGLCCTKALSCLRQRLSLEGSRRLDRRLGEGSVAGLHRFRFQTGQPWAGSNQRAAWTWRGGHKRPGVDGCIAPIPDVQTLEASFKKRNQFDYLTTRSNRAAPRLPPNHAVRCPISYYPSEVDRLGLADAPKLSTEVFRPSKRVRRIRLSSAAR